MRNFLTIAALAATTAFAAPAAAQNASLPSDDSDSIRASALLIQPATIKGVDNLDFGTLIASSAADGTVLVDANDANSQRVFAVSAGSLVAGAGAAKRGRLVGNGLPTQIVNLTWTFPTELVNEDDATSIMPFQGQMDVNAADNSVTIGSTGVFNIYVGGRITVKPLQAPGRYSGLVLVNADFQ
jgi:hypothetical protein